MNYKRASFSLIYIFTGILCLFAILLSTSWGTQLSLFLIGDISPIHTKYRSGAFLNDLQLSQLSLSNEQADINAKNIRLTFNLRCFWKNQLCIEALNFESLDVNIKNSHATPSDTLGEEIIIPAFFTLPFSINVKQLSLANVKIKTPDLQIDLTDFSSALSINNSALTIEKTILTALQINLYKNEITPVAANKTTMVSWPLATLPKIYMPFKFNINSFTIQKIIINEVKETGEEQPLLFVEDAITRLSWFKTKLFIDTLSSTIKQAGSFALKGDVNLLPPYKVELTLSSTINDNQLLPALNDSTQQTLLQGDLSHLAVTMTSQGSLALIADATINITDKNLPYELNTYVSKYTLPSDISQVLETSTFSLQSQGDINQQALELETKFTGFGHQNVEVALTANLHKDTLKIDAFHLQDEKAINTVNMTGELQLGDILSWNVNLDSSGITLPNIDKRIFGRIQGNIQSSGFFHNDEWALKIVNSVVKGTINNIPLLAKANIDINHNFKLAPSEMTLDYGEVTLNLKGFSDKKWHVNGVANIGSTRLWLKDIDGNLSSTIDVSGPIQQPEISIKGIIEQLAMNNISSDIIEFNVNYRPLMNHAHQINVSSSLVTLENHAIKEAKISSRGDLNQQQVALNWLGDSSLDLLINSQYSPTSGHWDIKTDNPKFSFGDQAFKSNQPILLRYNALKHTLAINEHCWLGALSHLCLNDNTVLNTAKGELTLATKIDMQILKPFIPKTLTLENTVDGSISIGWQPNTMPSVNAKLLINNGLLQLNKEDKLHTLLAWNNGHLNLTMDNNNIKGDIDLFSAIDGRQLLKANTTISLNDNHILESNIIINHLNISPINVFIPELSLIDGTLASNIAINGILDNPMINGEVKLSDAKVKLASNMNTLDNINMIVAFKGQQAFVSGAVNVNQVTTTITGNTDWQDELQGDFNFDGDSVSFSIPPDLTLTVSPRINAKITASTLKLSGQIDVIKGKLALNKLPQGSVSLSKDVIIVNEEGEQVMTEKAFNILTNVRVVIADTFEIEGQGFVGTIGGELQINQQARQPLQLFGSLQIPQGRYRAYGQDLSITKGNISFNGAVNTPYISIQATRDIEKEDILVGIDAKGLANNLQVSLFSKPSMQQSEVLSYLVRGRGLDAKTNNSNTAIGVALGTAITNFSGVLTQIEKLPFLNKLEIDGDNEQASIAGYLGEQVYIKYGVGVTEPIKELTVRFYLYSRLWVEAVSGLENSANIYYSFDIE